MARLVSLLFFLTAFAIGEPLPWGIYFLEGSDRDLVLHKVRRSLLREWNASEVTELTFNEAERTCLYKVVLEGKKECLDDIFAFQNLNNILLVKGQGQKIEMFELHPNSVKKLGSNVLTLEHVRFEKQISIPALEPISRPAPLPVSPPDPKSVAWYNKKEIGWLILGMGGVVGAILIAQSAQSSQPIMSFQIE